MSSVIGFDYGECRIGVAIGVPSAGTASPLTTLLVPSSGTPWDEIDEIIGQWQPDALVVGRVEHHTQDRDRIKQRVRNFCKALQRRYRLPVETVDESFSSARAYALLRDMRARGQRRKIHKTDIDKAAAAIILQTWFACQDGLHAQGSPS